MQLFSNLASKAGYNYSNNNSTSNSSNGSNNNNANIGGGSETDGGDHENEAIASSSLRNSFGMYRNSITNITSNILGGTGIGAKSSKEEMAISSYPSIMRPASPSTENIASKLSASSVLSICTSMALSAPKDNTGVISLFSPEFMAPIDNVLQEFQKFGQNGRQRSESSQSFNSLYTFMNSKIEKEDKCNIIFAWYREGGAHKKRDNRTFCEFQLQTDPGIDANLLHEILLDKCPGKKIISSSCEFHSHHLLRHQYNGDAIDNVILCQDLKLIAITREGWYLPSIDDINCNIVVRCIYSGSNTETLSERGRNIGNLNSNNNNNDEVKKTVGSPKRCGLDDLIDHFSIFIDCPPIMPNTTLVLKTEAAISASLLEINKVSISLGVYDDIASNLVEGASALSTTAPFIRLDEFSSVFIKSQSLLISMDSNNNRGLRFIPSNMENLMSVQIYCTHPVSVILCVPIRKQFSSNIASNDAHMDQWLNSSVLNIPWEYDANIGDGNVNNLEKSSVDASQSNESEDDSLLFANLVCKISEFVVSLPESIHDLKFCFTCSNRMDRDTLAATLRSLFMPDDSTMREKFKVLPWELEDTSNIQNGRDFHLMRSMQNEITELKKERSELTSSLLNKVQGSLTGFKTETSSMDSNTDNSTESLFYEGSKLSLSLQRESELQSKLKALENRIFHLEQDLSKCKKDLNETKISHTVLNHEKETMGKRLLVEHKKLTDLEEKYNSTLSILTAIEQDTKLKTEQISNLSTQISLLSKERYEYSQLITKLQLELENVRSELFLKNILVKEIETKYEQVEKDHLESIHKTATLVAAVESKDHELAILRHKLNLFESLEQKCILLQGENNNLRNKSIAKEKEFKKLLQESSTIVEEFEKALSRKSQESNDLQAEVYSLKSQLNEVNVNTLDVIRNFQKLTLPQLSLFENIESSEISDEAFNSTKSKLSAIASSVSIPISNLAKSLQDLAQALSKPQENEISSQQSNDKSSEISTEARTNEPTFRRISFSSLSSLLYQKNERDFSHFDEELARQHNPEFENTAQTFKEMLKRMSSSSPPTWTSSNEA